MWFNKAQTLLLALAYSLGAKGLEDLIVEHIYTGYLGEHECGYGRGQCPACSLRLAGWQRASEMRKAPQ